MTSKHSTRVAICPHCDKPFHYIETKLPIENDEGYWEITCTNCNQGFFIPILNPNESSTKYRWQIKAHDALPLDSSVVFAQEVVAHNIQRSKANWSFNVNAQPLYVCKDSGTNLDAASYEALQLAAEEIQAKWVNAESWYLAHNGPDHILVRVAG